MRNYDQNIQRSILDILRSFYKREKNDMHISHLSNEVSLRSYLQRGEEIASLMPPHSRILDWGAGIGILSLILDKLNFDVIPADIIIPEHNFFSLIKNPPVIVEDVALPFDNESFDAVVSCGVLEHVVDVQGSLKEIHRILKRDGYFFIFNLPRKGSPSEWYADIKKISVHPYKFTKSQIVNIIQKAGFKLVSISYENGIPKRLEGFELLRILYNVFPQFFLFVDDAITKLPLLQQISNSLKLISQK